MSHLTRFTAAVFLALSLYALQAVEIPGRVFACMCGEQASLAQEAATNPVTIVVGTVGVAQPDRTPIVVDTWFHGDFVTDRLWVMGGTQQSSSCDPFPPITAGERRVMVLWGGPSAPGANGLYSTSMCSANAVVGTIEGDALLADAMTTFGSGTVPASVEPEPAAPIDPSPFLGNGLIWAGAATGIGLLLLGALVFIARRRPAA